MTLRKFISTKLNTALSIIGVMTAIYGVWYTTQDELNQLTLYLYTTEELTKLSSVEKLDAEFKYDGHKVNNLWRVSLKLTNSGNETLIGEGSRKTLLKDSIPIKFDKSFLMINVKPNSNNDIDISKSVIASNSFMLKFDQWRVNESIVLSFLLESKNDKTPSPIISSRSIIDGNIVKSNKAKAPLIKFPSILLTIAKHIIEFNIFIIFFICIIWLIVYVPYGYWKVTKWEEDHYDDFIKFLDSINPNDYAMELMKDRIKHSYILPTVLPDLIWEKFNGDKFPDDYSMFYKQSRGEKITVLWVLSLALSILIQFFGN